MAIIKVITPSVTDANITTAKVTDNAITLAKMASGTDGNIISYDASGNPVAIATGSDGQVLTSAGAGAPPVFEALPVGGITNAQQWRISAAQSNMDNGDHVTNNWEVVDSYGYGGIGSAMTQSSGIFTFPSTGIWHISYTYNGADQLIQDYIGGQITSTTDNSSYNIVSQGNSSIHANAYFTGTINFMFDVTNTTTHKIRFAIHCEHNGVNISGNTNRTDTGAVFTRLGDT